MNEPRRLKHGGGAAELLLRSADADGPGGEPRRKAELLATTTSGGLSRTARSTTTPNPGATFVRWAALAAAASLPLAYLAEKSLVGGPQTHVAAPSIIAAETPADLHALAEARAALARRDHAAALSALDAYEAKPNGAHRVEALRLRAQVLRDAGRAGEASAVERQLPP